MGWAVFVGRSAAIIGLRVHAAASSQQRGAWTQLVTAPGGAMVPSRPLPSPPLPHRATDPMFIGKPAGCFASAR